MSNIIKGDATANEINQLDDTTRTGVKAIPDEDLIEFIELQSRFRKLYRVKGLISTQNSDGIHLMPGAFLATFKDYESRPSDILAYPEELYTNWNGVRFFCIR